MISRLQRAARVYTCCVRGRSAYLRGEHELALVMKRDKRATCFYDNDFAWVWRVDHGTCLQALRFT